MTEAQALADELVKHPAPPSDKETLALKPNDAASATEGPHPQVSQTGYVTWTKPDGGSFVAPVSNSDYYEHKGFKKGAEQDIPDIVAWNAENAAKEAPKAAEHPTRGEHAEAPKAKT